MVQALDNQEIVRTVRVKTAVTQGNPDGIVEINHFDYDPKKHQLADGEQASLELAPVVDPNAAIGSDKLTGNVDIGAKEPVGAGFIVGMAHSKSGLSISEWNALSQDDRDTKILAELNVMRAANNYKAPPPAW